VRTPPTLVRVGLEKDVRVLEVSLAIDMTASTTMGRDACGAYGFSPPHAAMNTAPSAITIRLRSPERYDMFCLPAG